MERKKEHPFSEVLPFHFSLMRSVLCYLLSKTLSVHAKYTLADICPHFRESILFFHQKHYSFVSQSYSQICELFSYMRIKEGRIFSIYDTRLLC